MTTQGFGSVCESYRASYLGLLIYLISVQEATDFHIDQDRFVRECLIMTSLSMSTDLIRRLVSRWSQGLGIQVRAIIGSLEKAADPAGRSSSSTCSDRDSSLTTWLSMTNKNTAGCVRCVVSQKAVG